MTYIMIDNVLVYRYPWFFTTDHQFISVSGWEKAQMQMVPRRRVARTNISTSYPNPKDSLSSLVVLRLDAPSHDMFNMLFKSWT
jgi:hypothetical protein